jgi:acetyl esterase/lipase
VTTTLPPPPFDPELGAALTALADMMPPTLNADLLTAMRSGSVLALPTLEELARDGAFRVEEREVPGLGDDPDITLLICTPTAPTGTLGCVYHTHGGGMVLGDRRIGMVEMLDWAEMFNLVVVSVEYRLAPETPHPGPIDDCYAGLLWIAAHADELGFDPDRMIVAGGSAGGGLAAALALRARDQSGPALLGQMLIYPMLDDRNDTPSAHQMAGLGVWDHSANEFGWTALLGDSRGGPDVSPYAAPARAGDLSALPPAFIDVGSAETFRDEDVAYASRIWQAGGRAELHVWPGGFHGFDGLAPTAQLSRDARDARVCLERSGEPGPVEAVILERAAGAARAVLDRTRGRVPAEDPALVELIVDASASADVRRQAATTLKLAPSNRFRVAAQPTGPLILPADATTPLGRATRAGIGPAMLPPDLPASYAAARVALRFAADGTAEDPGPTVVRHEDLGALALLADLPDATDVPDLHALEHATASAPWALSTLHAFAEAPSLRATATALRLHHSTLQDRIAAAEHLLGFPVRTAQGRLRLQLALALRRLRRHPA